MSLGILAIAALSGVLALLVLRAAPRGTVVLWVAVLFFVPIWVGVSAGPFWSAITLVTLLALATCTAGIELTPVDGLVAALAFLIIGQYALKLTSLSSMFTALTEWVLPYVWARMVLARVSLPFLTKVLASAATVAAVLGIVEAATGQNIFVTITYGSPGLYAIWGVLQERGGLVRVEGAFGHSIALGASLAMMSAFVLATRWRLVFKLAALTVIAVAITLTLSRIGLVTLVITIALALIVLPGLSKRSRLLIAAAAGLAALVVVPIVTDVFLSAGKEAGGSADYRLDLFSLFRLIPLFGSAGDFAGLTLNGEYFGDYAKSVDNAILVAALRVGLVPTALLIVVIIAAILPSLRPGTASAAGIAVAGQVPGLFAVAFITQYAVVFWFVVGLAVSSEVARRQERRNGLAIGAVAAAGTTSAPLIGFPGPTYQRASGGGVRR